jgi:CDGSH-type Zn-finger protein
VWKLDTEPWIDPDGAEPQAIVATIARCPSGALRAAADGAPLPEPARGPAIMVSKDGPYFVVGGPRLNDPMTGQQPQSSEHYTLCRCGQSTNKPFCDGTHWSVGFVDERN